MGKIFSNKNLIIKIATILVIVILFNFINPGISFGAVSGGIGGVLFEPIKDLVLAIGDGIVNIMQNVIFGTDVSLLKLEHSTSNVPVILGAIGGAIAGTILLLLVLQEHHLLEDLAWELLQQDLVFLELQL